MPSRKEEREALRQRRLEKEATRSSSDRKRLRIAYGVGAVLVAAVVVVIVVLAVGGGSDSGGGGEAHINLNASYGSTNGIKPDERAGIAPGPVKVSNLEGAAKQAGCVLELHLEDEGHEHIAPGSAEPKYETDPPTSGAHVEPPYQQADGAYREEPEAIDFVHSLEHGRLEIQYSPSLPEKEQLELKGLYDTMYAASLLFPNDEMPYAVAATTWTNLLGCKTYKGSITLDAIRAFGKATWGRYGGEPVGAFKFTGPTPAEPN
ncbi:MAG: DUF3105 domain-containing protein [Solirubrobacterales bacterium]